MHQFKEGTFDIQVSQKQDRVLTSKENFKRFRSLRFDDPNNIYHLFGDLSDIVFFYCSRLCHLHIWSQVLLS